MKVSKAAYNKSKIIRQNEFDHHTSEINGVFLKSVVKKNKFNVTLEINENEV